MHQQSRIWGGISQTKAQMGITKAEFWEKSVNRKLKGASAQQKLERVRGEVLGGGHC